MQNNIHHFDSDTAANSSSTSGRSESGLSGSWDVIPPLRNVSVGASFNTLIEEKKIQFLTDQLSEFNRVGYRTLPVNSSRGKNVIWTAKKVSMTTTDHINQQTVASYLREAVWPTYKMLQRVGVNGGMIKEVCVRWFLIKLQCRLVWILSHTGRQCYWE